MASVDYDPKKAHEYYMKHRKLKGRRSTRKFNQTQKEQYAYAKEQLKQQHKDRNAKSKEAINAQKQARIAALDEAKKKQKELLTQAAKSKIDGLRNKLESMPKEQRAKLKEQI